MFKNKLFLLYIKNIPNFKYTSFILVVFGKETRSAWYNFYKLLRFTLMYELHPIFTDHSIEFHLFDTADENQHLIVLHPKLV